jgi:hypothetical protein
MLPDFQWSHLHRSKEQIQTRNIDTRITLQISSNIKTYHVYISSYQVIECDSVKLGDTTKQRLQLRLPSRHVSSPRKRGSSRGDTTKLRRKPGSRRERRKAAKLVAPWYSGCSRSRACGVPTCAEATIARRPTSLNLLRRLLSIALARAVRGK